MSGGFRVRSALAAGLVAAAAALGCEAADDVAGSVLEAQSPEAVRLDPGPYRAALERIEAILYRPGPPEPGDNELIAVLTSQLLEQVSRSDPTPLARRHGGKLLFFSAQLEAQGEVGYSGSGRDEIRREWEALRDEVFEPASWFGNPATGQGVRAVLSEEARALDAVLADLEGLVGRARGELVSLNGDAIDRELVTAPGRGLEQWTREWSGRFRAALERLPGRPGPEGDVDVLLAFQSLDLALEELGGIDGAGSGEPAELQVQLARAEFALAEARRYLRAPS